MDTLMWFAAIGVFASLFTLWIVLCVVLDYLDRIRVMVREARAAAREAVS